jgi:hypothetical protein
MPNKVLMPDGFEIAYDLTYPDAPSVPTEGLGTLEAAFHRYHELVEQVVEPILLKNRPQPGGTDSLAKMTICATFNDCDAIPYLEEYACFVAGKVDWRCKPEGERPLHIVIHPDFEGVYTTNEEGSPIGSVLMDLSLEYFFNNVPAVTELERELQVWQAGYEALDEHDADHDDFDWPTFHKTGMALADRLKDIVKDEADIWYQKPFEDPDHETDSVITFASI